MTLEEQLVETLIILDKIADRVIALEAEVKALKDKPVLIASVEGV